jgi:hypothetical protein
MGSSNRAGPTAGGFYENGQFLADLTKAWLRRRQPDKSGNSTQNAAIPDRHQIELIASLWAVEMR